MADAALMDEQVAAAVAGDESAQRYLFEVLTPQIRIMVNARLNPTIAQTQLAEDIVQDSLLSLRESLGALERRTATGVRAFASTIVSRRVADALRDRDRIGHRGMRSLDSHVHADLSAAAPLWAMLSASGVGPLSMAHQADLVPRVMAALHSLKAEHRHAITLAFFDQLNTSDIASCMGISRAAASMLLIRAIKALRRNLTGSSQVIGAADVDGR